MSKYKSGDKVVIEVKDVYLSACGIKCYGLNGIGDYGAERIDERTEPLSNYTEPLEAKIRSHEAYINDLLLANERLSKEKEDCAEQARAEGAEAAWELARKIVAFKCDGGYGLKEIKELFGYDCIQDVMKNLTYSEAATKVEAWEKAKEEIKVGDVLEGIYDNEVKCIVTNLCPDNMAYLVFDDGTAGVYELDNLKKTGRHIDIDSFLKQIGGEQE